MMTERMANILRLKRTKVNVTIQGAGQLSKPVSTAVFTEVKSRKSKFSCGVTFLVMDKVTADLPKHNVSVTSWQLPPDLFLADPSFNQSQPIDLVLGAKHFHSFFPSATKIHLSSNLPILMDSVFGWVVTGANTEDSSVENYSVSFVSMLTLDESLERFWKTEELTTTSTLSEEERHCESMFASTVKRTPSGRYTVRLPRKADFALMLGESKTNALRRFTMLEKRLDRDRSLHEEYHRFMREYEELNHMRLVGANEPTPAAEFFLPHHPVIKEESSTTKVRVVFDGSAKTSTGHSLNEALCTGPIVN